MELIHRSGNKKEREEPFAGARKKFLVIIAVKEGKERDSERGIRHRSIYPFKQAKLN